MLPAFRVTASPLKSHLRTLFLFSCAAGLIVVNRAEGLAASQKKANSSPVSVNEASPYAEIDQAFVALTPEVAERLIQERLKSNANDPGLLWRKSRALVAAGDREKDKAKQLGLYEEARAAAEKAISLDASLMSGYLRRAISVGKIALFKGVLETRELVLLTKKDAEKAIELNNGTTYEFALAHYLLGRVHLKLSETPKVVRMPLGLAWGNIDEAEKFLEKAVTTFPTAPGFRVDYAIALMKRDKKEKAREELQAAASAQPIDVSDRDRIQEAKNLLSSL